jgi:hypothetical protein
MLRSFARTATSLLLIIAMLGTGCVQTRQERLARYEPGSPPIYRVIPRSGVYKVKWKFGDEYKTASGTWRYFVQGTPVGFQTQDDGTVVALAGDQKIPLGPAPRHTKYCCWYQKFEEETQFAKEIRQAAQTIVIGTVGVAGIAAFFVLEGSSNQRCDPWDHAYRR